MHEPISRLLDAAFAMALLWVAWRSWRQGRALNFEQPSRADRPAQFYAFVALFLLSAAWSAAKALRLVD